MIESGALGKKVLFLYPPPVLSETIEELARREFEVYLVKDHEKTRRFLQSSPDTLLFINLDAGMTEPQWEGYVKAVKEGEKTSSVGIGVLSLNEDADLKMKYLMDLQLPCGFITLKIGAAKTVDILSKTLEVNEARGKRKFVRAICIPGIAQCAASHDGDMLRGEILDFSTAGMAVSFAPGHHIKAGTVIRGITLTIKGGRLSVDGVVVAHRDNAPVAGQMTGTTSVVMFDPGSLDDAKREKLRTLIFKVNQANLDRQFESL